MTAELIGLIILILAVIIIAAVYLFTPTFRIIKETVKEESHSRTSLKDDIETAIIIFLTFVVIPVVSLNRKQAEPSGEFKSYQKGAELYD